MILFIEKQFIEEFFKEYNFDNKKANEDGYNILNDILTIYSEKKIYFDCSIDEITKQVEKNPFWRNIKNYSDFYSTKGPFESFFKNQSNFKFRQTIVLTKKQLSIDCKEYINLQGALSFSYEDFNEKICKQLEDYEFDISLTQGFSWNLFERFNTPEINSVLIADNYILQNKEDHLYKLLEIFFSNRNKSQKIEVVIITKPDDPKDINKCNQQKKSIEQDLVDKYRIYIDVKLVNSNFGINSGIKNDIDFHDRILYSNFSSIFCGIGFNKLKEVKDKNKKKILGRLHSESIFKIGHYKIWKREVEILNEYSTIISNPVRFPSNTFTSIPQNIEF